MHNDVAAVSCTSRGVPFFTQEIVRPFPNAEPRKPTNKVRRKRNSAILTDTPVKEKLEWIEEEKKNIKRI